jgi:putative addiction module CopG family antidote
MQIHLDPKLEAVIRQDLQRGNYRTIDEYVEHAVSMLHEQETWLASNRADIAAKIDEGYQSARHGELIEPDEVRSRLNAAKRTITRK